MHQSVNTQTPSEGLFVQLFVLISNYIRVLLLPISVHAIYITLSLLLSSVLNLQQSG